VFVHDAFVECVLVDDFQSRIAGDDEVAVVDLKGAEFVGNDFGGAADGGFREQ